MSLRHRLRESDEPGAAERLYERFGVVANPFPASNQTSANPRRPLPADAQAEQRIVTFVRDRRSQVVVISGTQGVGKTNFLNHFESEIRDVMADHGGYYLVRYLADPEASMGKDGTQRVLDNLNTRIWFRLTDDATARLAVEGLGMTSVGR